MKTVLFCFPPLSSLGDQYYFRTQQLIDNLSKNFNVSIIRAPSKTGWTYDRKFTFSKLLFFIFHLPRYLRQISRADAIVIFPSILWFFWILSAKFFNKKIIIDHFTTTLYPEEFINLPGFIRSLLIACHRLVYPKINLVITHTYTMKNHLIKFYQLPKQKIHVIYSVVDHHLFNSQKITSNQIKALKKAYGLPLNRKIIFYHGKRHTFHGMKLLHQVAALSFKKRKKYLFVFLSAPAPQRRNEYYLDFIKFEKLYQVLRLADLWLGRFSNRIQANRAASSCMLQAMAMEIPIITYASKENSSIIKDGVNGFLIKSLTPQVILNKIDEVVYKKALLKKIGQQARKTITLDYSLKTWGYINKLLQQLTSL